MPLKIHSASKNHCWGASGRIWSGRSARPGPGRSVGRLVLVLVGLHQCAKVATTFENINGATYCSFHLFIILETAQNRQILSCFRKKTLIERTLLGLMCHRTHPDSESPEMGLFCARNEKRYNHIVAPFQGAEIAQKRTKLNATK